MLEAHKSAAITELQLELVALREKELNFFVWHYSALLIVSGVFLEAALSFVLLGHPPVLGDSWQHALFQSASVCALGCFAMTNTVALCLSVMGPRLALCGPQGSMHRAVEQLRAARSRTSRSFELGIACFLVGAATHPWLYYQRTAAIACSATIALVALVTICSSRAIARSFRLPEAERVPAHYSFRDGAATTPQRAIATAQRWLQPNAPSPAPPPPARLRSASQETIRRVEELEESGRFVEAAELLAAKLQELHRRAAAPAGPPPPAPSWLLRVLGLGDGLRSRAQPSELF